MWPSTRSTASRMSTHPPTPPSAPEAPSAGPGGGHTADGLITWFPDERVLVIGDYLSELEIPFAYSSVGDYQATLHTLIGVIEREQPEFVVVGHGRPHSAERALKIADEDLDYIEAVLAIAEAGSRPTRPSGSPCRSGAEAPTTASPTRPT